MSVVLMSETLQACVKVTIEREYKVICDLSIGVISNEWPLTTV